MTVFFDWTVCALLICVIYQNKLWFFLFGCSLPLLCTIASLLRFETGIKNCVQLIQQGLKNDPLTFWEFILIWPVLFGFRWNESYKKDLFSSRIDTTKALAEAIAASPSPPQSWVLVSGVGKALLSLCWNLFKFFHSVVVFLSLWFAACYKPSQTAQYTEDSEWTPFDLLSKLVKEWEASALLPDHVAQTTKQVIIRPGMFWPFSVAIPWE